MKTRIIAGVTCASLIIALLFFMDTIAFPMFVALLSALSVYELNKVAKVILPINLVSMAVGIFIPFNITYDLLGKIGITPMAALSVYIITILTMMIKWYSKVKFEQVSMSIIASLVVPNAASCWIRLYNWRFDGEVAHAESHVVYIILFACFCAWLTDTFAYFTGVFLGKHKMAPVISPKKTWEGAIGGVIGTIISNLILFFVFKKWFFSVPFTGWDWYAIIPISIILSIVSMLGDLAASVIKRNYGIKDYGNLIPGHGGVMDRIDSAIFVWPAMYAILSIINAI